MKIYGTWNEKCSKNISRYYNYKFSLTFQASGGFVFQVSCGKRFDSTYFFLESNMWFCLVFSISPCPTFLPRVYLGAMQSSKWYVISISQISRKNTFCRIYSFPSMCGNKNSSPTHNRVASDPSGATRVRQTSAHTWDEAHCLSFHGAGKQTLIQKDCSLYGT